MIQSKIWTINIKILNLLKIVSGAKINGKK